jgi:tRNA-Thr(GGU) m(6)t(6)A37 methyltransferase TsaA
MRSRKVSYSIDAIGFISTCFPEKFGIPRQPLLVSRAKGQLILEAPYNDPECIEGLEGVSHLWLTFIFHEHANHKWKPKVRPPRLGGNKKTGVFSTRSSFRPNNLGLSVVKLDSIEIAEQQIIIHLSGVDLLDGTPIVDIKPYLPYVDSVDNAKNMLAPIPPPLIQVIFSQEALNFCDAYSDSHYLMALLTEVLQQDPRPAYNHTNDHKVYRMKLLDLDVEWKFRGEDSSIVVLNLYYI